MLQDLGREQSGPQVVSGGMAGAPAPSRQLSPENQDLAREPEEQYLRRLFNEYVHAREQSGEGTKDLSYGSFIDKLKANETELCKKYDCRAVRFKVIMKGGQATLKPVPLP